MVELGGVRRLVAVVLASAVLTTTTRVRAQDVVPDARAVQAAQEKARCAEKLQIVEKALEDDGRYAIGWRDAWLVTGTTLVALNLTGAFQVHGYRRTEGIVLATTSTLLMIQKPVAVTTPRALDGVRAAAIQDPCLALDDARSIIESNDDDWKEHAGSPIFYVIPIVINVLTGAILAAAVGHWDFVGNGNEGLSTIVGAALGELQVLTYPRSSVKVSATSVAISF